MKINITFLVVFVVFLSISLSIVDSRGHGHGHGHGRSRSHHRSHSRGGVSNGTHSNPQSSYATTKFHTIGKFYFNLGTEKNYTLDNCRIVRNLDNCTEIERNNTCPAEKLMNKLFDKLGINDESYTIFPILQNEAKQIDPNYNPFNFTLREYILKRKDDPTSKVNQMFANICGLTNNWPTLVNSFLHYEYNNKAVYYCKFCKNKWWYYIFFWNLCGYKEIYCERN